MEYVLVEIIIPVFTILVSILIGVYTVEERVKNENRESHKPYLVLSDVSKNDKIDLYSRHFNIYGLNNYLDEEHNDVYLRATISNIGYGVASNIKLYDLNTTQRIEGKQLSNKQHNQKLYTTFDIASNNSKNIDIVCSYSINDNEMEQDETLLLCVYQDLNRNFYNFIIAINYKKDGNFDYYAFQRTSKSYKDLKNNYKDNYNIIMKEYRKL